MKKISVTLAFAAGLILFTGVFSSCKKDSTTNGCVTGLTFYRGPRLSVGCMTKTEFYEYLDKPYFKDPVSGNLVDKELQFREVDDCSQCN